MPYLQSAPGGKKWQRGRSLNRRKFGARSVQVSSAIEIGLWQ